MTADINHDAVQADRRYRTWMGQNLGRAAEHFGHTVTGEPVFGWLDRSIGAQVASGQGSRWLRVVSEQLKWAHGDTWTGNADANVLSGVRKPRVLDLHEWVERDWRRQRAELMTLLPGSLCAPTDAAHADIDPPNKWWNQLRDALRRIAVTPTTRVSIDQAKVDRRVRAAFGDSTEVRIDRWETVHGDLHWANLLIPMGILDWELWGRGPAGTDAATLYCYSLAEPTVARRVHDHFGDVLDTVHGRRAQLYVIARLLHRSNLGDHAQLVSPLQRRAEQLLH
jgi:hypothetical protein